MVQASLVTKKKSNGFPDSKKIKIKRRIDGFLPELKYGKLKTITFYWDFLNSKCIKQRIRVKNGFIKNA